MKVRVKKGIKKLQFWTIYFNTLSLTQDTVALRKLLVNKKTLVKYLILLRVTHK